MTDLIAEEHVAFVGPMGAGKTTAGTATAQALQRPFSDSDAEIERLFGYPGSVLAQRAGIEALHVIEAAAAVAALVRKQPHVVALAASAVEHEAVRNLLEDRAFVVRVHAPLEVLLERYRRGTHRRAVTEAEVEDLAARRDALFRSVADHAVDTSNSLPTLVSAIEELLGQRRTSATSGMRPLDCV